MSAVSKGVLAALIQTAVDLHEPGEDAGEYTRGQAELIGDACGLPGDIAHETLMPLLYAEGKPPVATIVFMVELAIKEHNT